MTSYLLLIFLFIYSLSPDSIFDRGEKNIHGVYFNFDTEVNRGLDWVKYGRYVTVRELFSATIYMGAPIALDHNKENKSRIDRLIHDMTTPLENRILREYIPLPTWFIHRQANGQLLIHIRDSDHRTNALFELIIQALKNQRSDLQIDLDTQIPVLDLMKTNQGFPEVTHYYTKENPDMGSFIYQGFEHLASPIKTPDVDAGWGVLSEKIEGLLKRGRPKVYLMLWGYQGSGKTRLTHLIQKIGIAGLRPEEIDAYVEEETNMFYGRRYQNDLSKRLVIAEGYQAPGWFIRNGIYPNVFVRLDNPPNLLDTDKAREFIEMRQRPFDAQYKRHFFNDPNLDSSWDIIINTAEIGSSLLVRTKEVTRWDSHYWDTQDIAA